MRNVAKWLSVLLGLVFFGVGISAYLESKPSQKNENIYKFVLSYSPYYIEKRFGGLQIRSKKDQNFKETPSNMEVFKRFESLEKAWGQKYLKLEKNNLVIVDENSTVVDFLPIQSKEELSFIHDYYGL